MKRKYALKQFDDRFFAGMTLRSAGNFYPDGSFNKAFKAAGKILKLSGFNQIGCIIMRAEEHSNNIWFFEKIKRNEFYQVFCDGVIYRDAGAAVFFPGGCPAIVFRDEKTGISGMLHGGWMAVARRVIENFLRKWEDIGGSPDTTQIKFLPSICANCLTFDADYFKKVSAAMASHDLNMFVRKINEQYLSFDLSKFIEILLNRFGYDVKNDAVCVCCSGNHWCYRCDDKNGAKHRNAAFIITK